MDVISEKKNIFTKNISIIEKSFVEMIENFDNYKKNITIIKNNIKNLYFSKNNIKEQLINIFSDKVAIK